MTKGIKDALIQRLNECIRELNKWQLCEYDIYHLEDVKTHLETFYKQLVLKGGDK